MEPYRNILKQQEIHHAQNLLRDHGLMCEQMEFGDSATLYLAKPHWTNRFDHARDSTIGIFCCIWVSPKLLEQKQFAYNIHSKAIRKLPGYKLTSQKFASDFRKLVDVQVISWPNISLDHGPLTLLQGTDVCELDSFAEKITERINGFVSIHHHVDALLNESSS